MTISLVPGQSAKAGALTTSVTSVTVSLPANSTAGTCLLAGVMMSNNTAVLTPPSGWVVLNSLVAQGRTIVIYGYPGNPGGLNAFQFSSTVSGGMSAIVAEFINVRATSPLDQIATNNSAGSVTMDSGTTPTTTAANELLFAVLGYGGGSSRAISGVTNGFTADQIADASSAGATGAHLSDYYKVVSATGTANVSATLASSSSWDGLMVTLFEAPIIGSATLAGKGTLTATARAVATATLSGRGTLTAAPKAIGRATLAGRGTLAATGGLVVPVVFPTVTAATVARDGKVSTVARDGKVSTTVRDGKTTVAGR